MTPSRVVVTGMGVVTAWGWGTESFWTGVTSGKTAIAELTRFPADGYPTHIAAEVPDPSPENERGFRARFPHWSRLSRSDRFAVASTGEAMVQAGLSDVGPLQRTGVYYASSTGGMIESENYYRRLRGIDPGRPPLRWLASQQVSGPAEAVARAFMLRGPVETVSSACASGALAIGNAVDAIRAGEVQMALAGGSDSLCRTTYGGFNSLRSMDTSPCRPFRGDRAGLSLGEGGATLVLESLESALARNAQPLAEIIGAAASADAHHMTAPDPSGRRAGWALNACLEEAGCAPEAIDFINAHGTGTPLNDAAEWHALSATFGEAAGRIPVTSTKGSIGHLLGAAGAVEAVATILGLQRGAVHPTPGDGEIDSDAPVRLVRREPLALERSLTAASINLGFGGCNAVLLFGRSDVR